MGFSTALFMQWVCREGAWRKQLDQGTSASSFAPAVGRPACLLLKGISQSRFASCAEACAVLCGSSSGMSEIPATDFEAACKWHFPYAEPELNPDGPFLAASLRSPSLLSPAVKHLSDVLLLNRPVSLRILECWPSLHMLHSSALPASSSPSLVQLL